MSVARRNALSISLAVFAGGFLLVGAILLYARAEVIDEDAFANNAAEALRDDATRDVIATELVVGLVESGSPDLVAARPLVRSVVNTAIDTSAFRDVFREAARQTNLLLFERERRSVAFDLADAASIVRFALESVDPKLAEELPETVDLALLKLKERDFAGKTLQVADTVRVLGVVAPLAALILLALSIIAARDRRLGVLRAFVAVAFAGVTLAIVLLIVRGRVLAGVVGEDEITDAQMQDAVAGILDAFLGGLFRVGLLLALIGVVVAGAAAVLDPERDESPAARLWNRISTRPERQLLRALRALGAIAGGFLIAFDPSVALGIAGLLLGAFLVYYGAGELLLMLQPDAGAAEEGARRRSLGRGLALAGGAVAAIVVAVIVLTSSDPGPGRGTPRAGCNGSDALCEMRLNQVAFAGTHNSFSAADSPDWFLTNQRRTIERQLKDGIRLFLLDPHWGIEADGGRVNTDFEAEGRDRNKVVKALPPEVLAAAERLAGNVGLRGKADPSDREVFQCHTVCELGATRLSESLDEIGAFMDANPGEVVVIFIEPYVEPEELARVFEEAGLADRAATLDRGAPLPTLGELVRRDERLVVFTEKDADGSIPWYLDGFAFVQDTPLGATKVGALSCELFRGKPNGPILMLNHWADVFPPQRKANAPFLTEDALLDRAHECERERGLPVSFIATDHYDQGQLIEAVEALNQERTP